MPEVPTPAVNGHRLPLHGATSISSLEPAARTVGWLASTAIAGSFCLFCGKGAAGLPLETSTSLDWARTGTAPAITATPIPSTSTARRTRDRSRGSVLTGSSLCRSKLFRSWSVRRSVTARDGRRDWLRPPLRQLEVPGCGAHVLLLARAGYELEAQPPRSALH